ncbi:MAG: FxsA family protein [Gammaproteobacteria bacterium]|nr:FxsA family protein [Gammaproteobacteria bacterium]
MMIRMQRLPPGLGWLLLLYPIAEVFLFTQVSARIGFGNAVLAILAAMVLGVQLMRGAGLPKQRLRPEELPGLLFGQGFRLLAGLLLFIPGFLTDVLALLCLFPVLRQAWRRRKAPPDEGVEQRHESVTEPEHNAATRTGGRTVDGEFERVD